jgi:predicted ester cyclase
MKTLWIVAVSALTYSACSNSAANSSEANQQAKEERNKRIALASVSAVEKGNIDSVFKDVTPDAVDYGEGSNPPIKGLDSAKAGLKTWMAAIPNYKGSDFVAVADGDYVMVYGQWSGTWSKDFLGMKPTGRSFNITDVDIFKFNEDGKIIEHRSVQSQKEAARQLGMDMPSFQ